MTFRDNVRLKMNKLFNAGRAPGTSTECGAGYHRHADKYGGKCHKIEQKHEGEGNSTGNSNKDNSKKSPSDEKSEGTKYVNTKDEK